MASPYRDLSPPPFDEDQALEAFAEVCRARTHFRRLQSAMVSLLLVDGLILILLRGVQEGMLGMLHRGAFAIGAALAVIGLLVSVEHQRLWWQQRRQRQALPPHLQRRVDR